MSKRLKHLIFTIMEFRVSSDDEIVLPAWLHASTLTLEEIGAVVCLACLNEPQEEWIHPFVEARLQTEEFQRAAKLLKDRGMLSGTQKGSRVCVGIDIEKTKPTEPNAKLRDAAQTQPRPPAPRSDQTLPHAAEAALPPASCSACLGGSEGGPTC